MSVASCPVPEPCAGAVYLGAWEMIVPKLQYIVGKVHYALPLLTFEIRIGSVIGAVIVR